MTQKSVSLHQLELLIEFMERHEALARGRVRSKEAKAVTKILWDEISNNLNAEVEGTNKTPREWNKFWTDYKCRIKSKIRKNVINAGQTGGGPSQYIPLTPLEERLSSLFGEDNFEDFITPLHANGGLNIEMENTTPLNISECVDVVISDDLHSQQSINRLNVEPSTPIKMIEKQKAGTSPTTPHPATSFQHLQQSSTSTSKKRKAVSYLVRSHKLMAEIEKEKIQVEKERNEIERAKVDAINSLTDAAWAFVNMYKHEERKRQYPDNNGHDNED